MQIKGNHYYDMNGKEILAGDTVMMDCRPQKVYRTTEGQLGTDATNPHWVETGRAVPCEFGVYPFVRADEPILIEEGKAHE